MSSPDVTTHTCHAVISHLASPDCHPRPTPRGFLSLSDPHCATPVIVHQVVDHRGCLPTVSALPRCPQIRRRGEGTSKSPVPVRGSENHGKPRVT